MTIFGLAVAEIFQLGMLSIQFLTLVILIFYFSNTLRSSKRKRRKLINAIYYHVKTAKNTLSPVDGATDKAVIEKMNNSESYMPHIPRSKVDDLTYDHLIEVMEFLDRTEDEEHVSDYFHNQLAHHAFAASFDLEYVRNFSPERKLVVWREFKKYRECTFNSAKEVERILKEKRRLR